MPPEANGVACQVLNDMLAKQSVILLFFYLNLAVWTACTPTVTPASPGNDQALADLILLPDDLPAGFEAGNISRTVPEMIDAVPAPRQVFHLGVTEGQLKSQGITLLIYEQAAEAETAYTTIAALLETEKELQELAGVGEKARYYEAFTNGYLSSYTTKLVYIRCRAVVFVSLFSPKARAEVVKTYAQKLDRRLKPAVCR